MKYIKNYIIKNVIKFMINFILLKNIKKIVDLLESESNLENFPSYFKCPISWEKMENPVISMEGHR